MGLLNKSKVGLDIGASAVRVVEISGIDSSGYAVVRRAGVIQIPSGAVAHGEVRRPTIVAQAISEAFRSSGIARQGVVAGFASKGCAVGRFDAPAAALPEERLKLIRNSNHNFAPTVPTSESAVSWNLVSTDRTQQRPMNHLAVAVALRSGVRSLVDVCRLAEVELRAIDLSAAALLRSVVRIQPHDDSTISTVVDIGSSSTLIATRKGAHLRSVRTVGLGGSDITLALAGGLGIDEELAEEQKRHMRVADRPIDIDKSELYTDADGGSSEPKTTAEDILARTADKLVDEIARSVSLDSRENGNSHTQGVQLVGGGARLPGLAERVAETIGVPCTRATAWADVPFTRRTARLLATHDASQLVEDLTCAIGLAMWKVPR